MATVYDDFIDIVDDLFGEWGSSGATHVVTDSGATFDATTGYYSGGTTAEVRVKAILSPVDVKLIDGQSVRVGDVMIMVSPKGLTSVPVIGDRITRGSESYRILNTMHVNPADTKVVLKYHARAD